MDGEEVMGRAACAAIAVTISAGAAPVLGALAGLVAAVVAAVVASRARGTASTDGRGRSPSKGGA